MHDRQQDLEALTSALSTLTARVAVLERWMRRSQRRQTGVLAAALIGLLLCLLSAAL